MKIKKSALLMAALLFITLLSACGKDNTQAEGKIQITDMFGREVSLAAPASKIVVLTPSDCEILYALGAGDTVIARGEYCNYPEAVQSITALSSGSETNIEQIISLKPEVVLMNGMDQTKEQVEALENAGITVIENNAKNIDEVYTSIDIIGKTVGKEVEAAALIDSMKKGFSDIAAAAGDGGEKTVYFEVSPLEYGLWTAGSGTFMDEISQMLGVKNVFSDIEGWKEISQEQVIERNPDYIVTITMVAENGQSPSDEIMSRKGWESIKAVSSGKVITIDSDEISRPGPRLVDAAKKLNQFFNDK